MFAKLRRVALAARGWMLRRKIRELSLPIGDAAQHLGPDLFAGIIRCSVSANRALAAMELLFLNYQTRAEGEPAFDRNKTALTAWAASEMREAAKGIVHLRDLGVGKRLTVAQAEWHRLIERARRWSAKGSEYRTFREKFTAHRDLEAIAEAIENMSSETIVYARLAGPEAKHQYYVGADTIAFHAWRLHAEMSDEDLHTFAATMDQDVRTFAKDFERVVLELFEML